MSSPGDDTSAIAVTSEWLGVTSEWLGVTSAEALTPAWTICYQC